MPLKRCSSEGKSGWKWGDQGHCYTGPGAKQKAIKQGVAIEGPEKFAEKAGQYATNSEVGFEEFTDLFDEVLLEEKLCTADHVNLLWTAKSSIVEAKKETRKAINDLPDSDFAYIEAGGKKDSEGKTTPRSLRHFPIHDEAHVRNALARLPQSKLPAAAKAKALAKIRARAKQMGIEVSDKSKNTKKG